MNVGLVLRSKNSQNDELFFEFDDNGIIITSLRGTDNSQHDYAMSKEDYLFLREQFDKHFNLEPLRLSELALQTHPNT